MTRALSVAAAVVVARVLWHRSEPLRVVAVGLALVARLSVPCRAFPDPYA